MNPNVIYYPREKILEAAERFETPFFIYEEKRLRENCRRFKAAFEKYFPDFWPLFAVKANSNPEILKIIAAEGFEMDASSATELWLCEKLDLKGMHTGNYTPAAELKMAKRAGFMINLDDISQLDFLKEIGVAEFLSFRINPGIGKATIESNVFAGPDAKYGVPFEKAVMAYARAQELGVKHFGIHMMTGSNVPMEEKDYFAALTKKLFEVVAELKQKLNLEIELMNIGGGFGVPYKPEEQGLDLSAVAKSVREAFDESCSKFNLKEPRLMAEPGRLIAADSGWLVGRVQVIKDGYKKFVGIDASANDMPRPSIYGAYHHVSIINDQDPEVTETVSVVGSICENNDQFARDRELPKCDRGDLIAIHNCGGHAYAMGHNYNGKPRHAEYLIEESADLRQIRRAETFENLYKTVDL